ncbi:hypothetical protein TWF788_004618 [Orbilia oligospora]|uniref:Uncharacterized protein n=1 Tax=Orbilia oligospora TaxID=2813651 RepID=A0A7C8TXY1_ORBOL|nr:hypothetical protein TWF788_004618 [Orbilia oligospora]
MIIYFNEHRVAEKNTQFKLGISSLHDSGFNPKNGSIDIVQPPCGDHIDTVEANLAAIEAYNRTFGTLVASSGYKIDSESKNSIDWAMFKILADRSVFNMISGVDHEKKLGLWSSLSMAGAKFQGVADPVEDESVLKVCRKTDIIFSIISGVKDGVSPKENRRETME